MATFGRQKRPNVDIDHLPTKRRRASNFLPSFWDNLSTVWLTPRALQELDRRNETRAKPAASVDLSTAHLVRFARRGGPDLAHLRGYSDPHRVALSMSSNTASAASRGRPTQSTKPTTIHVSSKAKSSAYEANFEQHLIDHRIYPEGYVYCEGRSTPTPENMDSIQEHLLTSRSSLSPSRLSESTFLEFKRKNRSESEGTVMRTVIPMIAGNADLPNEGHLNFNNVDSLTHETTVNPLPDFFDGARSADVDKRVTKSLNPVIVPTKHHDVPVAPNFFLEVKACGDQRVAKRQACHDGAYGARAMHALKTYGETEPAYDGRAYTYSSTYQASAGILELYAHHMSAPNTADEEPEYHMTQLRAYVLKNDRKSFIEGATAFRNARDLAKRHRDGFIRAANAKAAQAASNTREELAAPTSDETAESSGLSDRFVLRDAEDTLQQQAVNSSDCTTRDDASASFESSCTSLGAVQKRSQRRRQSLSPLNGPRRNRPS